jgi:hypothetical protein
MADAAGLRIGARPRQTNGAIGPRGWRWAFRICTADVGDSEADRRVCSEARAGGLTAPRGRLVIAINNARVRLECENVGLADGDQNLVTIRRQIEALDAAARQFIAEAKEPFAFC